MPRYTMVSCSLTGTTIFPYTDTATPTTVSWYSNTLTAGSPWYRVVSCSTTLATDAWSQTPYLQGWSQAAYLQAAQIPGGRGHAPPLPPTPAEGAARQVAAARIERERRARVAARSRQRLVADARATALLLAHLTPPQQVTYEANGYFDVTSEDGQRTYRIHRGISHNVKLLAPDTGREFRSYCAHAAEDLPVPDILLGQALLLQYNEAEFLRVANSHLCV